MPDEPILPIDDPRLKQPSAEVSEVDSGIRALAERMFQIMDRERGAGLAAIQIGVPLRLVVVDTEDQQGTPHRLALVNPEIVSQSADIQMHHEGCLSMPGYQLPVERAMRVCVRFLDLNGQPQHIEGDGILAICLQHEIDHVNGILFSDRVSFLRRNRAKAHFAKVRRRAGQRHTELGSVSG